MTSRQLNPLHNPQASIASALPLLEGTPHLTFSLAPVLTQPCKKTAWLWAGTTREKSWAWFWIFSNRFECLETILLSRPIRSEVTCPHGNIPFTIKSRKCRDISVTQNPKQHHLTLGHVNKFNKQKLKHLQTFLQEACGRPSVETLKSFKIPDLQDVIDFCNRE